MQNVFRIWRQSLFDPVTIVIVFTTVLIATISGPFGTLEALPFWPRLTFWGVVVGLAATIGILLRVSVRLYFPEDQRFKAEVVTTLLFSSLFGGVLISWVSLVAYFYDVNAHVPPWWRQIGYVTIVTILLLAIRTFVFSMMNERARQIASEEMVVDIEPEQEEAAPKPVAQFEPRLMRRLPEDERSPILWLTSEDHFVDVHTRAGTSRLRIRLKDAIDEMEGVEGYCVHRSHWVARSAIAGAVKVGGYWRLHLTNGQEVPVSRKYQPNLEEQGILVQQAAE